MRDITLEETIYLDFTTRAFATGIPTTLAGTPVLSVLEENNATPITAGVSVSVDRASVSGLNMATVVATAANGYEDGKGYSVYVSTGTVGGVSVIGEVVAGFTIGASSAQTSLSSGVNVISISGDTSAADNLELQYDGTGYNADTAPSSRAQVGGLGGGSSSGFNYAVTADNTAGAIIDGVTFVGSQTGTFANTAANPESFHEIGDTGNAIDLVYRIPVGEVNQAIAVDIELYLNSNNDVLNIQLYDHIGSDWETQFAVTGKNGSAVDDYSIKPLAKHTGALGSAEAGNVYVRFVTTGQTSPTLFVATCIAEAVAAESTMGYESGRVYCDESGGTSTGVVQGIDGIFANQSDDFDNAQTIADALGSGVIESAHGNTITLSAALEGYTVFGNGGVLALGGQNVGSTIFKEFGTISGVSGTSGNPAFFESCLFSVVTVPPGVFQQCGCDGSLTMVSAGDYSFVDCYSIVAGATSPIFTKTPGQAITAEWRRFSGGVTLSNIESGDVYTISGELGTVTLNGANGTVELRGTYKAIVDNRTGSPTLNTDGAIKGVNVADILTVIGTPTDTDVSTDIANMQTDVDTANTAIGSLNDISTTDVNAEMVDVMSVDVVAESTGVPSASSSIFAKMSYVFDSVANRSTETSSLRTLRNRANSGNISTATISDNGTTFTKETDS